MLLNYLIALKKGPLFTLSSKIILFAAISFGAMTMLVEAASKYDMQQPSQYQRAIETLQSYPVETLTVAAVPFCLGYTCREIKSVQIPNATWEHVTSKLNSVASSAQMERALLSEVLSHIEVLMGRLTNTQYDIGGTFKVDSMPQVYSAQLDCVDEAFNMFMFLHILNNEGKLHWHTIGDIVHRGWLIDFSYPHTALSVVENNSGKEFVIDSWFHDGGRPPEVIPLQLWKKGWIPEDFKQ